MDRIERLLARRGEVLQRWDEFFSYSSGLAQAANVNQTYPHLEMRIGPRYPAEELLIRESIYAFLSNSALQSLAGFHLGQLLRSPVGALLVRDEGTTSFLNIGELGRLHYVEPLYHRNYQGERKQVLDLWRIAVPMLRVLKICGVFVDFAKVSCELRIEASLQKISGQSFWSAPNPNKSVELSTLAPSVRSQALVSSDNLASLALETTAHLMYQLRWPFGVEAFPTEDDVRKTVGSMVAGI